MRAVPTMNWLPQPHEAMGRVQEFCGAKRSLGSSLRSKLWPFDPNSKSYLVSPTDLATK